MHKNSRTSPIGMNVIDKRAMERQLCATSGGDAMFDLRRGGNVIYYEDVKMGGGAAKAIGLSCGDVQQVTSHTSC